MPRLEYKHPKYKEIERECQDRFDHDFNCISHDVVKKVFDGHDFEQVVKPSFEYIARQYENYICNEDKKQLEDEYCIENGLKKIEDEADYYEWLEKNKYDEITEYWQESENYPMWSTLFEAKDSFLSEKLLNMVDELQEIGIGVMEGGEYFNTMLFISGCGYDFYNAHWIPLYIDVLKWIKV